MFHYRQVLVRMRQGDSDRDIARSKTMGRRKLALVRETASNRGWLAPDTPLPTDVELAEAFSRDSMVEPLPPVACRRWKLGANRSCSGTRPPFRARRFSAPLSATTATAAAPRRFTVSLRRAA